MAKSVKDVMSENPCAIEADRPVSYAAKMMKQEDVGLAPIVDGDRLVGTLTDRDIAVRVVTEGRDPQSTPVRDVATKKLVTVEPSEDLDEALRLMAQHQVRRLPVVVLTHSEVEADVHRSYDLGANSHIAKPHSLDALFDVVEALGRYWLRVVSLPN